MTGVVAVAAWLGWERVRPLPAPTPGDAAKGAGEFFDSDLGSARWSAVPRAIFEALPEIFPDLMPEGWEGIGLFWKGEGHEGAPVGSADITLFGLESYSANCAICHTGRFNGKVVADMPNTDLDIQLMSHVLETAVKSGRLTADAVAEVAQKKGRPLGTIETWMIGRAIDLAKVSFAKMTPGWYHDDVGPGRSDALAGWKRAVGVNDPADITWVDLPAIFNQKLKERTLYDGSITGDMSARIMLTELRKGRPARDPLLHREVFDDLVAWMKVLTPPPYPFAVDHEKATQGGVLFERICSSCHGTYGDAPTYPNKRIDVRRVETDPERANAMNERVADALEHHEYKGILHVEPRAAYMPPALNGIYLTAPYLHNGSVPTLRDLLEPAEKRPVAFYRRWNEFDPTRVGLVCDVVQGESGPECAPDATQKKHDPRTVWKFDTRKKGNRNTGHTYGAMLGDEEKAALVEYLKTI